MDKFFKHNESGQELRLYSKIANGVILTHFDKKTGVPYGNESYQNFVTAEDLKTKWTKIDFKLDSTESMNRIITTALNEIVEQLENYGLAEEQSRTFKEFQGSSPITCSVLRDMVRSDTAEFKDFLSNDDDEFEFSSAEDLYNFLHGGMIPILKKMLIEQSRVSE